MSNRKWENLCPKFRLPKITLMELKMHLPSTSVTDIGFWACVHKLIDTHIGKLIIAVFPIPTHSRSCLLPTKNSRLDRTCLAILPLCENGRQRTKMWNICWQKQHFLCDTQIEVKVCSSITVQFKTNENSSFPKLKNELTT